IWQAQEEVCIIVARIVYAAGSEVEEAVHVVIQKLIEHLIADVGAKLEAVIAHQLAEVVRKLDRISCLRQLSFGVVTQRKPATHTDVRQAFFCSTKIRINSIGIARRELI